MKYPPSVDIGYRPLHDIAMGPLKAALLNCAMDAGVFDLLSDPVSPEEIAARLGLHPDNTRRLLDALATIDLLEKKEGRYRNLPLARHFLMTDSPTWLAPLLRQAQYIGPDSFEKLGDWLRRGPSPPEKAMDFADEGLWAKEVKTSAGWVLGGVGDQVADIVSGLDGFSSFETMLDMGSGHGLFSLYILARHPTLKSVLLDRASVLDAAMESMRDWEALDRVRPMPGDYIAGGIGGGYDLVYACSTLNFAIDCLDEIAVKVHDALKPGGYFVAFQDGLTHERTKPDTMLGAVIPAMMTGRDYGIDQGRIAASLANNGFRWVRSRTLHTAIGDMDMDIARKSP